MAGRISKKLLDDIVARFEEIATNPNTDSCAIPVDISERVLVGKIPMDPGKWLRDAVIGVCQDHRLDYEETAGILNQIFE